MRTRIGLDCDGVLADFAGYALNWINGRLGTAYRVDQWTSWHIAESFGDEADRVFSQILSIPDFWGNIPVYDGVIGHTKRLAAQYDLYVVSAVPRLGARHREEWLKRHGFPIQQFIQVDCGIEKLGVIEDLKLSAFVEDNLETALQVADTTLSLLVDRPWNRHFYSHIRTGTWEEIVGWLSR